MIYHISSVTLGRQKDISNYIVAVILIKNTNSEKATSDHWFDNLKKQPGP